MSASGPSAEAQQDLSSFLGYLRNVFPAGRNGRVSKSSDERNQGDLNRLALDLALSTTILSSEELPVIGTSATSRPETPANVGDFLSRAANLSLNDKEPPPIIFHMLPPRSVAAKDEDSDLNEPNAQAALQSLPGRSLLSEWTLGSDPSKYTWKAWRDPTTELELGLLHTRPIRPLPSPLSPHPPAFAAQHTYPHPPGLSHSQPHPPTISTIPRPISSRTMETLGGTAAGTRGLGGFGSSGMIGEVRSSSPVLGEGEMEGPMTQVERGPFGGRVDGKKKVKKRAGGF